jgi:hypothetical protein
MTEPTLHSLTQRLDRLERERHCWRVASVLLAAIVVALVNLGAATPQPADLRARSLTILDRSGHSRIRLAVDDDEVTHIDMWGTSRQPVVSLYAAASGGTVHVDGAAPGTAAILAAGTSATLGLHTKTGNASISIVRETDQPDPKLPGTSRSIERASLAVDRGVVRLMLNDSTGIARAVLGDTGLRLVAPDVTERRQPPSIVLFDEGGKLLWKAP